MACTPEKRNDLEFQSPRRNLGLKAAAREGERLATSELKGAMASNPRAHKVLNPHNGENHQSQAGWQHFLASPTRQLTHLGVRRAARCTPVSRNHGSKWSCNITAGPSDFTELCIKLVNHKMPSKHMSHYGAGRKLQAKSLGNPI